MVLFTGSPEKPDISSPEAFVASFEGFSATCYRCSANKRTIGYGTVCDSSFEGKKISEEEALKMMKAYIDKNILPLVKPLKLNKNQEIAVISFAFNTGKVISDPKRMIQYNKYTDKDGIKKVSRGLEKRRKAEVALFNKPI